MRKFLTMTMTAALLASAQQAFAEPPAPDAKALITPAVLDAAREFINTDIVRISIEAQNDRFKKLSPEKINELDEKWKAERKSDDQPLIAATLASPLSVYLSRVQGRNLGLLAEIFVMDQNGLNVGQSSITSDFWQGDEAKFQKTYDVGPDAVFIDDPEWDEDFKIWRCQANLTVNAADGKTKIGAVTLEYNLTELQRRAGAGT